MEEREKREQQVAVVVVVDWVACLIARLPSAAWTPSTVTSSCCCYSSTYSSLHSSHSSGRRHRDSSKTAAVDTNNTLRSSATVKATTTTATLASQTSTSTPLSLPPLTICQPQAPTPPYQRLTKALQCDPRCGHEVSERGRVRETSARLDLRSALQVRHEAYQERGNGREGHSCCGDVCMLNSDVTAQERNREKKVEFTLTMENCSILILFE